MHGVDDRTRFYAKVIKAEGCWIWNAARANNGYGCFFFKGRLQVAHRVSWQLENGDIPEGMVIMHSCDNPPCVNPAHLSPGTRKQNAMDMAAKGRHYLQINPVTHCKRGHEFTPENTYRSPGVKLERSCRLCNNIRQYPRNVIANELRKKNRLARIAAESLEAHTSQQAI